MYSDLNSSTYDSIIKSQNVSVPYDQFQTHFLSILDRISALSTISMDPASELFS